MFKALFTALFLVGVAAPVVAAPTYENRENIEEHIELLNTIQELGINVVINDHLTCTSQTKM